MQFSYTSEYYKERLRTFIGEDALEDDDRVIRGMMDFIRPRSGYESERGKNEKAPRAPNRRRSVPTGT